MTTLTFSNGKDVLVHYQCDVALTKRRYSIEYNLGKKNFILLPKTDEILVIEDNFNVYEIQDRSFKFRKVYDLKTRNEIPRGGINGRELNMIVWVAETGKYYQLVRNPRASYTEDTDWSETLKYWDETTFDGMDFESSIPFRPQFSQIEYTVEKFREFAANPYYAMNVYSDAERDAIPVEQKYEGMIVRVLTFDAITQELTAEVFNEWRNGAWGTISNPVKYNLDLYIGRPNPYSLALLEIGNPGIINLYNPA
jgi:hypothetical protein